MSNRSRYAAAAPILAKAGPGEDVRVVEGGSRGDAGLEQGSRGVSGVAFAQAVLLECHDGYLLGQSFARGLRRHEVARAFEDVGVVRCRPVVVREDPVRL